MANSEQRPADQGPSDGTTTDERRREMRYPIDAKVRIRRQSGELIEATAVNISSSGMRVYIQPCPLSLDEEVTVEVELLSMPDSPFSAWGLGRVVYLDSAGAGIQLFGGHFDLASSGSREE